MNQNVEKERLIWITDSQETGRIYDFLLAIDDSFAPPLSERVNSGLKEYAKKISEKAHILFCQWGDLDVGMCALYCNTNRAFVTLIAVKKNFRGKGFGKKIMEEAIRHATALRCDSIALEVRCYNTVARNLYKKLKFKVVEELGIRLEMSRDL